MSAHTSPRPDPDDLPTLSPARFRTLNLALAALAAAGVLAWLALLWQNRFDAGFWQRDWYCLWSVGRDFLAGRREELYAEFCAPGFLWLYPPYAVYPWAVLALLPPLAAYLVVVAGSCIAVVLSFLLLRDSLRFERPFATFALAVLASAALNATLVTGQHSAWLLLAASGAVWAAGKDRAILTGLFLAIFGLKPNWVLLFLAWMVVSRRWKSLAATVAAGGVMIFSTLPMGPGVWRAYLSSGEANAAIMLGSGSVEAGLSAWKLVTIEAFLRSLLGYSPGQRALWIAISALVLAGVCYAWLRDPDPARQLALAALAVVAVNPYVNFYDLLVLAVPAALWWSAPASYPGRTRRLAAFGVLGIWVYQWTTLYLIRSDVRLSLVGGLLLVWLLADLSRSLAGPPTESRAPAGRDR